MRAHMKLLVAAATFASAIFACTTNDGRPPVVTSRGDGDQPGPSKDEGPPPSPPPTSPTSTAGPDGAAPPEGDVAVTKETMTFDGRQRKYLLAKPTDYDATKRYPLVLSFHGNPGTAEGQAQGLPFDSASKREAVIVYPQALDGDWDLYTATDENNDMNFVLSLIGEVKTKVNIDEANVLGFGYSGGAFFITQMACRFAGVFKAISVNAGGGPDEPEMGYPQHDNGCYVCPGGPTPTIVTHGAADTGVTPDSGEFTANCFATTNGCEMSRSPTTPSPCELYDGCPAGKAVKWCLIPGQGHGPWQSAMKEAWAFFKAL